MKHKVTLDRFPGGKQKVLTMSYDDGFIYDRRLVQIFDRYGIKGTFHLNSGFIDTKEHIQSDEIKSLYKNHEVAVHTVNHPTLTSLPKEQIIYEILEDRRRLESLVRIPVTGMSYPFGTYSESVKKMLPSLGIEYSRTVYSTYRFDFPDDIFEWNPTCHHNENLMGTAEKFLNAQTDYGRALLLYVWGHSFEFERQGNWGLIEEFCQTISNQETIWYATNIEIVSYLKAMKNLVFSADLSIIHNPSAIDVWISVDEKPVRVKAGELKKL